MQRFNLVALFALLAFASVTAANHDLIIGQRAANDVLLKQTEVDVVSAWFQVREKDVTIAGDGQHTITRVEAIDIKKKPASAKARIISGGPGQTYVSLRFVSERGHGIHFLVKVYGKRLY